MAASPLRENGLQLNLLPLSSSSLTCETIPPDRAVEADRCYFDISIYMSSYAEQAGILSELVLVLQPVRCLDPWDASAADAHGKHASVGSADSRLSHHLLFQEALQISLASNVGGGGAARTRIININNVASPFELLILQQAETVCQHMGFFY